MKPVNPFLIYGYYSPEYFCDRVEETQKLISALRNGRNVTLMSPRRMGKTGLIKNAFYQMQQADKEYVYASSHGYIVYDRFMGFWLQTIR